MSKVRPNTYLMYRIATFDGKAECYINCFPQQKWECVRVSDDKKSVTLSRKNVTLTISVDNFTNNWKVVE